MRCFVGAPLRCKIITSSIESETILPVRIALVANNAFVANTETARAVVEILQSIDEARIVAVCGESKSATDFADAESLARRCKARAFRDVKTLLRDQNIDAICCIAHGKARRDVEIAIASIKYSIQLRAERLPAVDAWLGQHQ